MIADERRRQGCPHVARVAEAVQEDDGRPLTSDPDVDRRAACFDLFGVETGGGAAELLPCGALDDWARQRYGGFGSTAPFAHAGSRFGPRSGHRLLIPAHCDRNAPAPLRPAQRRTEIAAKFLGKIDRYAGVGSTLPVEKLSLVVERHDGTVPNVGMDIVAAAAVALEGDELLRRHMVARQGKRNDEALSVQRVKKLTAIEVVIGAPNQRALTRFPRPSVAASSGQLLQPNR